MLLNFGERQILKTNHIPDSGHHFFRFFFQISFKVEVVLPYNKSAFFNVLSPDSANEFSVYGNIVF